MNVRLVGAAAAIGGSAILACAVLPWYRPDLPGGPAQAGVRASGVLWGLPLAGVVSAGCGLALAALAPSTGSAVGRRLGATLAVAGTLATVSALVGTLHVPVTVAVVGVDVAPVPHIPVEVQPAAFVAVAAAALTAACGLLTLLHEARPRT